MKKAKSLPEVSWDLKYWYVSPKFRYLNKISHMHALNLLVWKLHDAGSASSPKFLLKRVIRWKNTVLTEAKRKQSCIMYPVYTVKVISIFKENIFKGVREEWSLAIEC